MRACSFKTKVYKDGRCVEGETKSGTFHQWSTGFEEFTNGAVEVTMGIVEDSSGQVHLVDPTLIKFTKGSDNLLQPLPSDYQLDN
ncbi:hypothetical protein MASR1M48_17120 [Lactococcus petauri]